MEGTHLQIRERSFIGEKIIQHRTLGLPTRAIHQIVLPDHGHSSRCPSTPTKRFEVLVFRDAHRCDVNGLQTSLSWFPTRRKLQ